MAPQGELQVRLILGDRASLDTTFRVYYISRVAATESTGSEDISRIDTALTIRIYNLHGITFRYSEASRNGPATGAMRLCRHRTKPSVPSVSVIPCSDMRVSAPSTGGPAPKKSDPPLYPGVSAVHNIAGQRYGVNLRNKLWLERSP